MLTIALRDGRIHGKIHSLAEDGAMFLELGATAILKAAVAYRVEVFTRTAVESLPRPVAPPKRVKCPILASVATKHLQFGPAALYWLGAPRIDPPLLSALLFFLLLRPRLFVTLLLLPLAPPLHLIRRHRRALVVPWAVASRAGHVGSSAKRRRTAPPLLLLLLLLLLLNIQRRTQWRILWHSPLWRLLRIRNIFLLRGRHRLKPIIVSGGGGMHRLDTSL